MLKCVDTGRPSRTLISLATRLARPLLRSRQLIPHSIPHFCSFNPSSSPNYCVSPCLHRLCEKHIVICVLPKELKQYFMWSSAGIFRPRTEEPASLGRATARGSCYQTTNGAKRKRSGHHQTQANSCTGHRCTPQRHRQSSQNCLRAISRSQHWPL